MPAQNAEQDSADAPKRNLGGRPSHVPTEQTRIEVKALSALGVIQEQMAEYLGLDIKTLRKHYERELIAGKVEANRAIANTLFRKAMKGDTACMIFWMKSQGKWSERTELVGPDGGPVQVQEIRRIIVDPKAPAADGT